MGTDGKTGEAVLDAIVEAELESDDLIEATTARLDVTHGKLKKLARRLYKLRSEGQIGKRDAKTQFIRAFVLLALAEYAHDVPKLKDVTDRNLKSQYEAIKSMGSRSLRTLRPVRDVDLKARKAAKDGKGKT